MKNDFISFQGLARAITVQEHTHTHRNLVFHNNCFLSQIIIIMTDLIVLYINWGRTLAGWWNEGEG